MSPLLLAVALILAGLAIAWLSSAIKQAVLAAVIYWVGVVIALLGLVLVLAPILIWLRAQLQSMLGA